MSEYQLGMFETYPAKPGWKARETAQEAATAQEPKAPRLRGLCLDYLLKNGPSAPDEVAEALGIDKLSIRPRFSELAALGKIEDSGQRGYNASGKRCIIWRLV